MALFRSLGSRPFAWLWAGQTVSRLGDSLYRIALAWWVLEKTGSATAMGTVLIFSSAPMVLFLLIGGVTVDRLPRPAVMLSSDILRSITVAIVTLLALSNQLQIWHIYVASTFFGLVDAFFQPAFAAIVPDVIPTELLPSANSLANLSDQVAGIVGPAVGAAIVGLGGTSLAFGLDGLSFLISAACLFPIQRIGSALKRHTGPSPHFLTDLRQGISFVLGSPWLWVTMAVAAMANMTMSGPFSVVLPFLVRDTLHADVGALGLLYSFASAGSIVGAVWLGRLAHIRRRGPLTYGVWILSGLLTAALGLPVGLYVDAALVFLRGMMLSIGNLVWVNIFQGMVPGEMRGRVASVDAMGSYAFTPLGYGVAGWAADRIGPALVFLVGGLLTAILMALGLAHPQVRRLD